MDTIDKIGRMQHAAQKIAAVREVKTVGAGIAKILLAAPRLIGEEGPPSSEQASPHVSP
jgi:hypothetical protein